VIEIRRSLGLLLSCYRGEKIAERANPSIWFTNLSIGPKDMQKD